MRITSVNSILGTYNKQKFNSGDVKKVEKSKDVVAISKTAKEYQVAQKALTKVSDVRQEKIDELKSRVESGTYNVNASEIADKIVNNMFDTKA